MEVKMGEAYGFFDCEASKERIEAVLPDIRSDVKTPSELELSLMEGPDGIRGDSKLMACYDRTRTRMIFPEGMSTSKRSEMTKKAEKTDVRYVMKAVNPGATNEDAARGLGCVLNCVAHMSSLYDGAFRGAVVYEENGEYVLHE